MVPNKWMDIEQNPERVSEVAEKLSTYAELLATHGLESPEAKAFFQENQGVPLFAELARESYQLEKQFQQPPGPRTVAREAGPPSWRRSGRGWLMGVAGTVLAALLLAAVGTGLFLATDTIGRQSRDLATAQQKLQDSEQQVSQATRENAVLQEQLAAAMLEAGSMKKQVAELQERSNSSRRKDKVVFCMALQVTSTTLAQPENWDHSPTRRQELTKTEEVLVTSLQGDVPFLVTWALKDNENLLASRGAVTALSLIGADRKGTDAEAARKALEDVLDKTKNDVIRRDAKAGLRLLDNPHD
jgi:hypothetical protein